MSGPSFALGTFQGADAAPFPGLVTGERVTDLRPHLGPDVATLDLFEDWDAALVELTALAEGGARGEHALADLRPCPPVRPRQLLCAGANYRRHVVQMAAAHLRAARPELAPDAVAEAAERDAAALAAGPPFLFAGLPSALCGAHDDIVLWGPGTEHDWELELAVVIGRGGRDIPVERAEAHVAGYLIVNDVTVRDVVRRPPMPYSDLVAAKSRRTFFPAGPFVVPRAAVADPGALRLTLRVNGETMQDDTTADLVHGVAALVASASSLAELYPGDVLATGSPGGNAAQHGGRWLRPGDVVEAEISGLGRQRNRCIAPPAG